MNLTLILAVARRDQRAAHHVRARRSTRRGPGPGPTVPAGHDAGQDARGARAPAAVLRPLHPAPGAQAVGHRPASSRAPRRLVAPRSGWPWPATPTRCARSTSWASRWSWRAPWQACCSCWSASSAATSRMGLLLARRRRRHRLHRPRDLAQPAHQGPPQGDPAQHPGRPRPADHLGPRRSRLRCRAGQGRGEDEGPAHRRVPAGARRAACRQGPQGCPARHRRADPGARR